MEQTNYGSRAYLHMLTVDVRYTVKQQVVLCLVQRLQLL